VSKQLTLFGEQLKDELDGYSPERKKAILERRKEIDEHNQRCEDGKCPVCNGELSIWYALGGKKILGCSSILCSYKGVES